MKIQKVYLGNRISLCSLVVLFLACRIPAMGQGTVLYALGFTAQDVGAYQVTAGNPTVQSSVGPFADALVFAAQSAGEQIRLPIATTASAYDCRFDVLTHNLVNSDYAFDMFIDTTAPCSLDFDGGLNTVYAYQSAPFLNLSLGSLTDDSVYHLDVLLDTRDSAWSVAINGTAVFAGSLEGASLQDIRFGLAPWLGGAANAPNTYAALDNVIVSTVPEPATAGLAAAGFLFWLICQRRNPRNWNREDP